MVTAPRYTLPPVSVWRSSCAAPKVTISKAATFTLWTYTELICVRAPRKSVDIPGLLAKPWNSQKALYCIIFYLPSRAHTSPQSLHSHVSLDTPASPWLGLLLSVFECLDSLSKQCSLFLVLLQSPHHGMECVHPLQLVSWAGCKCAATQGECAPMHNCFPQLWKDPKRSTFEQALFKF